MPSKQTRTPTDVSEVLPRVNARLNGGQEASVNFCKGGQGDMPPDLPIEIEVCRHMSHTREGMSFSGGLLGHDLVIKMTNETGEEILIKTYRPSTTGYKGIKLEVDGTEVYSSVAKQKGK